MKKIGIYAESNLEYIDFIRRDLDDKLTNVLDLNKKYVYLNPFYPQESNLEKLRGCELSVVYFASKRIEQIYDFFNYTKSRIR